MTQEMVSHHEVGQMMDTAVKGIMQMLGITLTAEMGQTPWLNTSDDKPVAAIVDLSKMADNMREMAHDMAHDQKKLEAVMNRPQHPYGLCDDIEGCPTCRDQRRVFAASLGLKIEKASLAQAGTEIDLACQWAKQPQLSGQLSSVLAAYREAGSPGMAESPEPELAIVVTPS